MIKGWPSKININITIAGILIYTIYIEYVIFKILTFAVSESTFRHRTADETKQNRNSRYTKNEMKF